MERMFWVVLLASRGDGGCISKPLLLIQLSGLMKNVLFCSMTSFIRETGC